MGKNTQLNNKPITGRPPKYKTPEDLEVKINEYFDYCDKQETKLYNDKGLLTKVVSKPYTITGLCLHLDIDKTTLTRYEDYSDEFCSIIKKARTRIEEDVLSKAVTGQYNPVFSMFNLKCNFGYDDKSAAQIVNNVTHNTVDMSGLNNDDLAKLAEMASKVAPTDEKTVN